MEDDKTTPPDAREKKTGNAKNARVHEDVLLALFRLLLCERPPDHDFSTCPICKRHGIREI